MDVFLSEGAVGFPRTSSPSDASNEKNGKKVRKKRDSEVPPLRGWTRHRAMYWPGAAGDGPTEKLRGLAHPCSILALSGWEALWLCSGCVCSSETDLGWAAQGEGAGAVPWAPVRGLGRGRGWCDEGLC